ASLNGSFLLVKNQIATKGPKNANGGRALNPSRCYTQLVKNLKAMVLFLIISSAACHQACYPGSRDISGLWSASVLNKAADQVAFTLDLKKEGNRIAGTLVNGDDRVVSTDGQFDGRTLKLRYDFYEGELEAVLDGDKLEGTFDRQWQH